uniref:Uncharacterized protein n=1 Tax=Caenorhabditis japonica TaxID=281687 RepID=A0A8R1E359_CAEJA
MSIAEYAKKISELSNNANLNEEASEQIALSVFLHGLNAPLRKKKFERRMNRRFIDEAPDEDGRDESEVHYLSHHLVIKTSYKTAKV